MIPFHVVASTITAPPPSGLAYPPTAFADSDTKLITNFTPDGGLNTDLSVYGNGVSMDGIAVLDADGLSLDGSTTWAGYTMIDDYLLGSGDFTIELLQVEHASTSNCTLMGQTRIGGTNQCWNLYWRNPEYFIVLSTTANSGNTTPTFTSAFSSSTLTPGTPYDYCFERVGDDFTLYRDGAVVGTFNLSISLNSAPEPMRIGVRYRGGSTYDDHAEMTVGAFRITTGTALYDGVHTPPTVPLPVPEKPFLAYGEPIASGCEVWYNLPQLQDVADGYLISTAGVGGGNDVYQIDTVAETAELIRVRGRVEFDDHDGGSVIELADGHYLLVHCDHQAPDIFRSKTTIAGDLSSMPLSTSIDSQVGAAGYTYTQLFEMEGASGTPILLIGRHLTGSFWRTYMSTSTDGGVTWGTFTDVIAPTNTNERSYSIGIKTSSTRVDFVITDENPNESSTNAVHHYYWDDGSFFNTDGTSLTVPANPTDMPDVYDGLSGTATIWDIIENGSGNPTILYQRNVSGDLHYWRAVWNGSSWDNEFIANGGGPLYVAEPNFGGGICFDPQDQDIVYASIEVSGVHQIHKIVRTAGPTWTATQYTNAAENCFRPMVADGVRRLLFVAGVYTTFTDFQTQIVEAPL